MSKLNQARDKYLRGMQADPIANSPLGAYINHLRTTEEGSAAADQLEADLYITFTSESGLRVLRLLEKSVLLSSIPNGSSEGALRENNAVRNFVHEIRRLVSNAQSS